MACACRSLLLWGGFARPLRSSGHSRRPEMENIYHPPPMSPSQPCIFCSIASGQEVASVVARDGRFCAFLDFRPVFKGHVLVVPIEHTPDLFALPEAQLGPYFSVVRRIAAAIEPALGAQGTFVGVNNKVSQSVPHLHAHVVPRSNGDGL